MGDRKPARPNLSDKDSAKGRDRESGASEAAGAAHVQHLKPGDVLMVETVEGSSAAHRVLRVKEASQSDSAKPETAAEGAIRSDVALSSDPPETKDRAPWLAEHRFKPGNPGPTKGYRKQLTDAFLKALREDFDQHGAKAVAACRTKRPAEYVRIVASLLPKQIDIREGLLDETADEELGALIEAARSALLDAQAARMRSIEGVARVVE